MIQAAQTALSGTVRGDGRGWSEGGEGVVAVVRLVGGWREGWMSGLESLKSICFFGDDMVIVL